MAKTKTLTWQDAYDVVGLIPGVIFQPQIGEIDLSKTDIPLETIDKLYEAGCPFVSIKTIVDKSTETPS